MRMVTRVRPPSRRRAGSRTTCGRSGRTTWATSQRRTGSAVRSPLLSAAFRGAVTAARYRPRSERELAADPLELADESPAHLVRLASAVDPEQLLARLVVVDHRDGVLHVDLEPALDDLLGVITAAPAREQPPDQLVARHVEVYGDLRLHAEVLGHGVCDLRLLDRPREAVEDVAAGLAGSDDRL